MPFVKSLDVLSEIKHIHAMCRFLGLAPYTITKIHFSGRVTINYNIRNNFWTSVLSLITAFVLFIGNMMSFIYDTHLARHSVSYSINLYICIPLVFTVASVGILTNLTVNKNKMAEFLAKISYIDIKLNKLTRPVIFSHWRCKTYLDNSDILVFIFVVLPYYVFDAWIWNSDIRMTFLIYSIRYGQVLDMALMLHYCKCVGIIHKRLSVLNKYTLQIQPSHFVIHHLRNLFGEICEVVDILNSMYGPVLLLELIKVCLVLVNLIPFLRLLEISLLKAVSLIFWKIMAISELIYIVVTCQTTIFKLQKLIQSIHRVCYLRHTLSVDAFQQLTFYFEQISTCDLKFTVCGLFKLDYSFLCSVLGSLVTYTIILFQFK
ncbi:hypothetical protein L9F63_023059 [Diploptera punctata]|uniref:Gustatory receptor n=1 Tax=Diploptera punctata TaxID=6984 RepID=A0AAD7ZLI1_DIPPU|nr:hypothetical protein L9F63_023059 [Diploptera punctata]